ncbi:MAG: hypothetical protein HY791_10830 [Deltaproteobacteria bacterium]|nr:hypothetical protein [Deltaproteobacteria bacterium]
MKPTIHRRKNERCLRGMQWVLWAGDEERPVQFDPMALAAWLERALSPGFQRADEIWGQRVVPRLIVPYEFEVRITERPGGVTVIHRFTAPPPCREENLNWVAARLAEFLEHAAIDGA